VRDAAIVDWCQLPRIGEKKVARREIGSPVGLEFKLGCARTTILLFNPKYKYSLMGLILIYTITKRPSTPREG
jgi:hypothetical protein